MVILSIGQQTRQTWEESAARDRSNDPGTSTLSVPPKASDRKCEDCREDAGFEEEDEGEHRNTPFAMSADRRGDEDHDCCHEDHEDDTGLDKHLESSCCKLSDGEEALAYGIAV